MLVKLAAEILPGLSKPIPYTPLSMKTERKGAAREIIQDDDACATPVFRAAQLLLGQQMLTWEPESIWLELETRGIDVSQLNRDKIMSCSTMLQIPAFYWDANMFENVSLAFNDTRVIPESLQEASPAQLSWAVYEVEMLMQSVRLDPDFDYEPKEYAAVCMHREGLVLAPEILTFAQEELDKLTRGNQDIKGDVEDRWKEIDKTKLDELELEENPKDVQLGKLAAIHMYIAGRAVRYVQDLARLFA